jgi:glycerol-3-phosphate acyltransferase PlsX
LHAYACGGTDALGFAYAIGTAVDLVRYEYKSKLIEGLGRLQVVRSSAEASSSSALQASGGGA